MKNSILLSVVFILLATGLWAGEGDLSVKAEVNKAVITVGERLEYRVTVTHGPMIKILTQIIPPPSEVFEVREAHDLYEKQGEKIVEGRNFVLTTYELGEFILDPIRVNYQTPGGKEKSIETNRLYITVQSVDRSGKEKIDIRDVKGVLNLKRQWKRFITIGALTLLAGGGFLIWRQWRKRRLEATTQGDPSLTAEEEALLRLSRLFDSDLLRQGGVKEYFLELSQILRVYFERRFEITAVEATTHEIVIRLKQSEIPEPLLSKMADVLEAADLAKFAKWVPSGAEILKINQQAKQIVVEAKPQEANAV